MADDVIPIVQRPYDFAVALYGYVNRFPRMHKLLLGRELMGLALRLLVTLVTANRRRDKVPELEEASGVVDALRITLRLSMRLGLLSHKGYEALSRDLDEIGRMLGGWLKHSAAAGAETTEGPPRTPDDRLRRRRQMGGRQRGLPPSVCQGPRSPDVLFRIAAGQRARCKTIQITGASAEVIRAKLSGIIERPSHCSPASSEHSSFSLHAGAERIDKPLGLFQRCANVLFRYPGSRDQWIALHQIECRNLLT
jgi:hypothetical protein